jgi:hypothetical protein
MGKISGYAIDSTPNVGDKLIGTDVNDLNATKNFTIGQILSLGATSGLLVPYTGATGPVTLGVHGITANSFTKAGGTSSQFLKADGSVDANTYLTSSSLSGLVPYTGASTNVNLGSNSITANSFIKVGGTSAQFLKANGTVDSNTYLTANTLSVPQVLNGTSFATQAPSALDTPLLVSFGAAQSNVDVSLDAGGTITFNTGGVYFINAFGSVERQGSSGGVAILLFRVLLNGTQISATKGFHLDSPNLDIPYEVTIPFKAQAGDVMRFQIMRDSSGINQGGLYGHTVLGGWPNVPSSQIQIWKLS